MSLSLASSDPTTETQLLQSYTSELAASNFVNVSNQPSKATASSMLQMSAVSSTTSTASLQSDLPDDFSMAELLAQISSVDEEVLLAEHGYERVAKISHSLQGEIFMAEVVATGVKVAIKKTCKSLYQQKIAVVAGVHFCIEEDAVKEANNLKLCTDHEPIGDYLVKFIEFFESSTHFYLVTEYIEGRNMKEFVEKCHLYIEDGKMDVKQYQTVLRHIMWQLSTVVLWLHQDMHCAHLDLSMGNIILKNAEFTVNKAGEIVIDSNISIKLGDFGLSELFKFDPEDEMDGFACSKESLFIDAISYCAPEVHEGFYDARGADMWALGMILYTSAVGTPPYEIMDIFPDSLSGYWHVHNGQIKKYITQTGKSNYINSSMLALMNALLNTDADQRLTAAQLVKHQWFESHYADNKENIEQKSRATHKLLECTKKAQSLQYYEFE
jgi:serine/threonine protein kinase